MLFTITQVEVQIWARYMNKDKLLFLEKPKVFTSS